MADSRILNERYQLLAQQGAGGMSVVYKARDITLGRIVAVKVLRPSLTTDSLFLERFREEARAVANLSHPNIISLYDFGVDKTTYYMVMEFIEGQDLKKLIRTVGVLSVDQALKLSIQICSGIGFAHRAGLIHADIKPQNVMVTRENTLKVMDFGIAQVISDTRPSQNQEVAWGSPQYFSPEQAHGERPTPASDVYSIGIIMFEMLTGRLPYIGATHQDLALAHIKEAIPLITEFNPSVPDPLNFIVAKVMSKEAGQRFRSADQLGHILQAYYDRGNSKEEAKLATPTPPLMPLSPMPTQRYTVAPTIPTNASPSTPKPLHIFISYSSQNRPLVENFASILENFGYSVWFDRELRNTGGQRWWDNILEQVRATDLFVFALTPESMASYPCKLEYQYAHHLNKRILPVMLKDVDIQILPVELVSLQFVRFVTPDTDQRLLESLKNLPVAKPMPQPLPPPPIAPIPELNRIAEMIDAPMHTEDEQILLVAKLENYLDDPVMAESARALLIRLKNRRGLYASTSKKIERLLAPNVTIWNYFQRKKRN